MRRAHFYAPIFAAALACRAPPNRADSGASPTSLASSAASASGSISVDATTLGGLCMMSAVAAPPGPYDGWRKEVNRAEVRGQPFAWITLDQTRGPTPREDARRYFVSIIGSSVTQCCTHASDVCRPVWDSAQAHSALTAIVLVDGTAAHGTWAVLGVWLGRTSANAYEPKYVDGGADDARKRAVDLAEKDVGGKIHASAGPVDWTAALR